MLLTDLISNSKSSGLRFETQSSDTKIAVLDADEVDALIKAIKILTNKVLNSSRTNYTEVNFISRCGFEAGCYFDKDKVSWTAYLKLVKYESNSYVWLDKVDFTLLLSLLTSARAQM